MFGTKRYHSPLSKLFNRIFYWKCLYHIAQLYACDDIPAEMLHTSHLDTNKQDQRLAQLTCIAKVLKLTDDDIMTNYRFLQRQLSIFI